MSLDENSQLAVGTGVILVNPAGSLLLAKRTDNGQWSVPGGALDIGESLEQCAARELFEETGVVVFEDDLIFNCVNAIIEPVIKNGQILNVVSISYYAKVYDDSKLCLAPRELREHIWVSPDKIKTFKNMTPYSKIAIKKYLANL